MRPVSPLQEISRPFFFHLFIGNALVLQFDPERKKIYVGKRTSLEHVTDVLRYFGPYLEQLYFYTSSLSHRYFSLVLKHCTPGRLSTVHLSIPEDVEKVLPSIRSLLEKFGPGLKALSISGESISQASAEMIVAGMKHCTNLKCISLGNNISPYSADLWQHMGANLEYISLYLKRDSSDTRRRLMTEIREHCRRLIGINFGPFFPQNLDGSDYLTFVKSFGSQLIRAPFGALDKPALMELSSLCPNLHCEWNPLKEGNDLERLKALGNVLESVSILFHDAADLTLLSNALAYCKRLVTLHVPASNTEHEFQMVNPTGKFTFYHPMMELRNLTLRNCISCTDLIELLRRFTPKLIKLDVKLTDFVLEGAEFAEAVSALPDLQRVRLADSKVLMTTLADAERESRAHLFDGLIQTFGSACKMLNTIIFSIGVPVLDNKEFRRICFPLRTRAVFCSLFQGTVEMEQYRDGSFHRGNTNHGRLLF